MAEKIDEPTVEEPKADIQALLDDIRQLLENNALEVWQSYRQIRIE